MRKCESRVCSGWQELPDPHIVVLHRDPGCNLAERLSPEISCDNADKHAGKQSQWRVQNSRIAANAGKERWQAWGWAAAGVLLSLGTSMMLVVVSYVHRDLETAMSGKDHGGSPDPPTATVFHFIETQSTETCRRATSGKNQIAHPLGQPGRGKFSHLLRGGPKLKRLPPSCLCPWTGRP